MSYKLCEERTLSDIIANIFWWNSFDFTVGELSHEEILALVEECAGAVRDIADNFVRIAREKIGRLDRVPPELGDIGCETIWVFFYHYCLENKEENAQVINWEAWQNYVANLPVFSEIFDLFEFAGNSATIVIGEIRRLLEALWEERKTLLLEDEVEAEGE